MANGTRRLCTRLEAIRRHHLHHTSDHMRRLHQLAIRLTNLALLLPAFCSQHGIKPLVLMREYGRGIAHHTRQHVLHRTKLRMNKFNLFWLRGRDEGYASTSPAIVAAIVLADVYRTVGLVRHAE